MKLRNRKADESLIVTILSFGFKYGVPTECDYIFDVRFLPNPYYVPELKKKTGLDPEIQQYILQSERTIEFFRKLQDMIEFIIPNYIVEGKQQLVIGVGCTGGQHRSVTIAGKLYNLLNTSGANYNIKLIHRDIDER